MDSCGDKEPHMLNPCVAVKAHQVWVNTKDAVRVIRLAFERMGYAMGPWLEGVQGTS